jgi:AGZA family xanthine/uracil permease-like MFS transporter
MGARAGYSVLNGVFISAICLTGALSWVAWVVPVDAGMAIILWIGIVITAQAFETTPRHHAPAVVMGLLPGVGAWGALMAKNGLRAAGMGTLERPFTPDLIASFKASDTWIHGAFALEQGFIFTAMVLASITVCLLERQFHRAAAWALLGAALSAVGLMHGYAWTPGDTVVALTPGWSWAAGYGLMAALFALAPWVTVPGEGH